MKESAFNFLSRIAAKQRNMKTPRDYIKEIRPNDMNFKQIAGSGIINGSLLIDIEYAMMEYARQKVNEQRDLMAKHLNLRNVPKPTFETGLTADRDIDKIRQQFREDRNNRKNESLK